MKVDLINLEERVYRAFQKRRDINSPLNWDDKLRLQVEAINHVRRLSVELEA
jgi:hypothetical protein